MTESLPRRGILSCFNQEPCHAYGPGRARQSVTGSGRPRGCCRSMTSAAGTRARASGLPTVRRSWSWFFLRTAGSFSASTRLLRMVSAWVCWMRDVAALALVAVEHVVVGLAAEDRDQLVGEVERVVHAASSCPWRRSASSHARNRRRGSRGRSGTWSRPAGAPCRRCCRRSRSPCRSAGSSAASPAAPPGRRNSSSVSFSLVGKCTRQRSGGPSQWNRFDHSSGSEM